MIDGRRFSTRRRIGGDHIYLFNLVYSTFISASRALIATLISAVCVAMAATEIHADEPAHAETPKRTYTVDAIECNCWYRDGDDSEPIFRQFIWWSVTWDKHERQWWWTDRGWNRLESCTLYVEQNGFAVESGNLRVEAPELFFTFSNVDTEIHCRHDCNYIW